ATRQQELADVRAAAGRLAGQVAELQEWPGRATQAEARLRDAEALAGRLRQERDASQAAGRDLADRITGELDSTRAERDRRREEADQALAECARLANDLDAVRAEREQLARDRQEDARQAEQLRARIEDLERAQAEAAAAHAAVARGHEEASGRWEAERRELHGQWGEKHRT